MPIQIKSYRGAPVTLRQLVTNNPSIIDLPIVVYKSDGEYEHVGGSASVYIGEDYDDPHAPIEHQTPSPVLVFADN